MFRSFKVKNFRCFREFSIEPLERVNLIAGKNNVGKTALLEALFLRVGFNNPELPTRVNVFRGVEIFPADSEGVWGWLFFQKHTEEIVELTTTNDSAVQECLEICFEQPKDLEIGSTSGEEARAPVDTGSLTTQRASRDLVLRFRDASGESLVSRASITTNGNLRIERAPVERLPSGIYLTGRPAKENASRFSELLRIHREGNVLETMKMLEPRLRRLVVLALGETPTLYGDLDGVAELVPLPFMGQGMVHLLSIVLAVANAAGGAVMVDEIENGLHHSMMVNVWKAISEAARKTDTQVFATTHSWECVQAAHEAFLASDVYDFRLHRLDRVNGDIKAVTYDKESLDAALKTELEVR